MTAPSLIEQACMSRLGVVWNGAEYEEEKVKMTNDETCARTASTMRGATPAIDATKLIPQRLMIRVGDESVDASLLADALIAAGEQLRAVLPVSGETDDE